MTLGSLRIKIFLNIVFWWVLWFFLLFVYALILHNNYYVAIADHAVYFIQLTADALIGIFSFLSYKQESDKKLRRFLLIVFLSICIGLFANEVYNLLFNIIGLKTTSAVINELWLIPYTIFLILQILSWGLLTYNVECKLDWSPKEWYIKVCFYQAAVLIILSSLFTTALKKMLVSPLGSIQIINTTLEAILFAMLSISLAKSNRRSLSYLSTGFLILLAFNIAHRFSYMSGYYYKTFDIAWLISFVYIIFGLGCFINEKNEKVKFHSYNSLHVITGSILMLFTSILFILFISLEFFITTLEVNAVGQVNILIDNMPSILIFAFTIAAILSKVISRHASLPLEKITKRIRLMQDGCLNINEVSKGNSNIHEIKNLDTFILKTLNQLQIANRAKSEFLMNMSHDFRTPASGICSMSKLLYQKMTDEKMKRLQKLVVGSSKQLLTLLDDVLEYSKLDNNSMPLDKETVNVNEILNEVITFSSAKVEEKGLIIKTSQPDIPLYHDIDRTLLQRILINLISNAIKFTENGSISVSIEQDMENNLAISVKDSGIGISPDNHDKIFEPFIRVESAETSKYSGIGLGLSNVKLMLHKLGGQITLSSSLGKGSIFTVVIPS